MARRTDSQYYLGLWNTVQIRAAHQTEVATIARRIVKDQARYQEAQATTGVAWPIIGFLHSLEAGGDFACQILNGEPWNRTTTLVPKGRGPWASWLASTIEGLRGFPKVKEVAEILEAAERWNGMGYVTHPAPDGINSPYLWSFTNHYEKGKFVADGVFDPDAASKQAGCAAILWMIQMLGAWTPGTAPPSPVQPPAPGPVPLVPYAPQAFSTRAEAYQTWLIGQGAVLKGGADGKAGRSTSDAHRVMFGDYLQGDPRR